ncbi:hypothetical protein D9M69_246610 [compost metagenome]
MRSKINLCCSLHEPFILFCRDRENHRPIVPIASGGRFGRYSHRHRRRNHADCQGSGGPLLPGAPANSAEQCNQRPPDVKWLGRAQGPTYAAMLTDLFEKDEMASSTGGSSRDFQDHAGDPGRAERQDLRTRPGDRAARPQERNVATVPGGGRSTPRS